MTTSDCRRRSLAVMGSIWQYRCEPIRVGGSDELPYIHGGRLLMLLSLGPALRQWAGCSGLEGASLWRRRSWTARWRYRVARSWRRHMILRHRSWRVSRSDSRHGWPTSCMLRHVVVKTCPLGRYKSVGLLPSCDARRRTFVRGRLWIELSLRWHMR